MFFGSAISNFGVEELLRAFVDDAPAPLPRVCRERRCRRSEPKLTGFVFKIQANMDPGHRDRIAFLRLCSGRYQRGMRIRHVRLDKELRIADALTFMAADRTQAEEAYAGDIIGLHNHGTINIGDSFSEGEPLHFTGIPNFAPEIFRRAVLKDPLRMKALAKGLDQLCEEGATQLFRPLRNTDLILGAVGQLQFEVVAFRLQDEYGVQCVFDNIAVHTARWVSAHGCAQAGGIPDARPTTTWRSITAARWCIWRPRASICSSRRSAGRTSSFTDARTSASSAASTESGSGELETRRAMGLGTHRLGQSRLRHHGRWSDSFRFSSTSTGPPSCPARPRRSISA